MRYISCSFKKILLTSLAFMLTIFYFNFSYVEYSTLEQELIALNFRAADLQTTELMLRISGRKALGDIPFEYLANFSCEGISEIDHIWKKYTNNKFGFSVQLKQWKSVVNSHSSEDFQENFNIFENLIGWNIHEYSKLDFSLNAPSGALPSFHWLIKSKPIDVSWNDSAYTFLSRLEECQLK